MITVVLGIVLEQAAGPNWAIIATSACTLLVAVTATLFGIVRAEIKEIKQEAAERAERDKKEASERAERIEQNTKQRAAEIEKNLEERADQVEAELARAIAMLQREHKDSAYGITKQLERDRMDMERHHAQNMYFAYHMMLAMKQIPGVGDKIDPDVLIIMHKELTNGQ